MTLFEPQNTYPINSGLIIQASSEESDIKEGEMSEKVAMGIAVSHSMMGHFINNSTYDLMLIRSERNEDTKGLWTEQLIDEEYANVEMNIVVSKFAQ